MKSELGGQRSEVVMGTLLALLLAATTARAQTNYAIDWFTVDGGGGTSTGGFYSVTATIGQPDAGRMSGVDSSRSPAASGRFTPRQHPARRISRSCGHPPTPSWCGGRCLTLVGSCRPR